MHEEKPFGPDAIQCGSVCWALIEMHSQMMHLHVDLGSMMGFTAEYDAASGSGQGVQAKPNRKSQVS
ncbi:oxidoreductase [Anopheles sinensis]|uniref:Oxidoreductase n=1 Tax=Anopheles sinensis TaxID=74873 RepID=A0A084VW58_ANOSI|nr:oxidoreductase [Anopheles sinensis]